MYFINKSLVIKCSLLHNSVKLVVCESADEPAERGSGRVCVLSSKRGAALIRILWGSGASVVRTHQRPATSEVVDTVTAITANCFVVWHNHLVRINEWHGRPQLCCWFHRSPRREPLAMLVYTVARSTAYAALDATLLL